MLARASAHRRARPSRRCSPRPRQLQDLSHKDRRRHPGARPTDHRPARADDAGPPVGAHIPALLARGEDGAPLKLASLVGRKGVVLVFFRSSKWCPFYLAQLVSLRDATAPLTQRGYRLAAISYQSPAELADFAQRRGIDYTLLSDEGSRTIDAFHLSDRRYKPGSIAYGVPQPSIFVISPDGVIRAKLAHEGYKVRPDNVAVVAAVDALAR